MSELTIEDLMEKLVEMGGSDMHIQAGAPVYFRVSGKLAPVGEEPLSPQDCQKLIFSMLNNTQRKELEQTWEIDCSYGVKGLARFRVNVYKERGCYAACLRALSSKIPNFDQMGLPEIVREMSGRPRGLILVTGPTGSGKTTTLYSALSELNRMEDKLITTEDPVEYDIEGIIQIPIDHDIGVTFASCLRAILRQDPDVILVGEIRDLETAQIAVQASLTGHMVFSTLHTNDAASTITRMKDMGVPTFLITATVEAILAQRLVRRVCSQCREPFDPTDETLAELGMTQAELAGRKFFRGKGCEVCNNTGYKGRVGLFELMIVNDELREMVMQNASIDDLREAARRFGMVSLRDAGMAFAYEGTTSIDEVIRETITEA